MNGSNNRIKSNSNIDTGNFRWGNLCHSKRGGAFGILVRLIAIFYNVWLIVQRYKKKSKKKYLEEKIDKFCVDPIVGQKYFFL